jgi:hypothetical protein
VAAAFAFSLPSVGIRIFSKGFIVTFYFN